MRGTNRLSLYIGLAAATLAMASVGCDDVELTTLEIRPSGLTPLAGGYHYEAWADIDGAPVTLAKFNVDASEAIVDLEGFAIEGGMFDTNRDLSLATGFSITIEGPGDIDINPSDSTLMSGPREDNGATMTVAGMRGLGDSFADASGRYFLATPTDGNTDQNETSGLWFFDISTDPASPGLNLPRLPDGFMYEGWAVIDGTPVTTGRFRDIDRADSQDPFSESIAQAPSFPGEDFLINDPEGLSFPTDLSTMQVVITIEPEPDDSPLPFRPLRPLTAEVRANAATRQTFELDNNSGSFPTIDVLLLE